MIFHKPIELIHSKLINYYNQDKNYFKKISDRKKIEYRAIIAFLKIMFKNKQCNILDVGCGTGNLLKYLNEEGFSNLTGIEISNTFVNHINKKFKVKNVDILNYETKKKFDCIICTNMFEHAIYPNKILKKIYLLLNKNGILIIQGPNLLQLISKKKKINNKILTLFIKRLFSYYFKKNIKPKYITPKINKKSYNFDDADAIYQINPLDLLQYIKIKKFKIQLFSTFFDPLNKYSRINKKIIFFCSKLPILKYMGFSILIIASKKKKKLKNNNKIQETFAKIF
ncbi:class I SAM-dependent methyltransferase [Candidatus Woesearchaeota archaeon]|jgi:2-polyprenyl-3-methyl-5-hydroxy-6-metoxy-1,4-benzoquinol methylase|nr:class I SAM-dependent methyltransferase [Candidatus Woesearchaeota archaeon]